MEDAEFSNLDPEYAAYYYMDSRIPDPRVANSGYGGQQGGQGASGQPWHVWAPPPVTGKNGDKSREMPLSPARSDYETYTHANYEDEYAMGMSGLRSAPTQGGLETMYNHDIEHESTSVGFKSPAREPLNIHDNGMVGTQAPEFRMPLSPLRVTAGNEAFMSPGRNKADSRILGERAWNGELASSVTQRPAPAPMGLDDPLSPKRRLVDLIQDDFPRTPSPLFANSRRPLNNDDPATPSTPVDNEKKHALQEQLREQMRGAVGNDHDDLERDDEDARVAAVLSGVLADDGSTAVVPPSPSARSASSPPVPQSPYARSSQMPDFGNQNALMGAMRNMSLTDVSSVERNISRFFCDT